MNEPSSFDFEEGPGLLATLQLMSLRDDGTGTLTAVGIRDERLVPEEKGTFRGAGASGPLCLSADATRVYYGFVAAMSRMLL